MSVVDGIPVGLPLNGHVVTVRGLPAAAVSVMGSPALNTIALLVTLPLQHDRAALSCPQQKPWYSPQGVMTASPVRHLPMYYEVY